MPEADLLILDEPAAGLDPGARAEVRGILDELSGMGRSILVSSHILADLDEICDEVCIIEEGRQILHSSITELRQQFGGDGTRVRLALRPADVDKAVELLETIETVTWHSRVEAGVEFVNSEENSNGLLQQLIAADIEVLEMHRSTPDLESIYIRAVKGLVT